MINLLRTPFIKIIALSSVVLLLQACGGEERTTPYNPGTSSSSSSSALGATVTVTPLASGAALANSNYTRNEKQLIVIRTPTEYNDIFPNYYVTTSTSPAVTMPDFNSNQVVLVDLGEAQSCDANLGFSSLTARLEGNQRVKVFVNYVDNAAKTSGCTPTITHYFYFYTIPNTKLIVFEENNAF